MAMSDEDYEAGFDTAIYCIEEVIEEGELEQYPFIAGSLTGALFYVLKISGDHTTAMAILSNALANASIRADADMRIFDHGPSNAVH